jgi:hypothetical protein
MYGMKGKAFSIVLCVLALCGIGALLLLRNERPGKKAVSRPTRASRHHAPTRLDRAAYDTKMRQLANILPRTDCGPVAVPTRFDKADREKAHGTVPGTRPVALVTREAVLRPCPAPLWPTHAAYPVAGAILPFKRIVAYYGNFYSTRMGILGEFPADEVIARLTSTVNAWKASDPSTPVVPAVDYIVVSAQGTPGRDGMYRLRMPQGQIDHAMQIADRLKGLVFLDIQPGWSTVEVEVPRLASYLKRSNVELALDPEFTLTAGKQPGAWVGTMSAAQINFAARFLAKIVRENHLPPKILVIHRFTERMVTDYRDIKPLPEVQIVMDMDGFGSPILKTSTYKAYIARQPVQFTGFKLFYKNDVRIGGSLMTPAQILSLSPRPSFILYQ